MKRPILFLAALALVGVALCGCVQYPSGTQGEPIEEGVIFAVQYDIGNGRTEGFTRLNDPQAIPGGNGRANINAYGKLYSDFLLIRFPDSPDLNYQAIPVQRLYFVQFGRGGIHEVGAGQSGGGAPQEGGGVRPVSGQTQGE